MKELTMTIIVLATIFSFGYCSTRADEIEPVRWAEPTIDRESLDLIIEESAENGVCIYGEMPEINFSLYYCKEKQDEKN